MSNKIFGIGFHKTGTTTLNVALSELRYKVRCSAPLHCVEAVHQGNLEPILEFC